MGRKLPKGLREFEGSLYDLKYAPELLKRLLDLPDNDFKRDMTSFKDAMIVVEHAEYAAEVARENARRIAERVWRMAKRHWTIKQLKEATGYDHE